ncbi:hypothetical protein BaRGS_00036018 [Batillaria attramentaria]|uniref:Uncharacterized protein n=1 Tax=Batillaria attramentaria TaxID=370345 RepID=A0ABD0JEC0_9CAEN
MNCSRQPVWREENDFQTQHRLLRMSQIICREKRGGLALDRMPKGTSRKRPSEISMIDQAWQIFVTWVEEIRNWRNIQVSLAS